MAGTSEDVVVSVDVWGSFGSDVDLSANHTDALARDAVAMW
jgi:hypothetical protein